MTIIQQMREVFTSVIKTHKPEKFDARLKQSRSYSFNLKYHFEAADYVNDKIQKGLASFFQEKVLTNLDLEFDKVCDEMLEVLKADHIDIVGGPAALKKYAPNVSEEAIKTVLENISASKDFRQHVIYKELHKWQDEVGKKTKEQQKKMTTFKTKDFAKEL
jgi:hypothetical protein